MMNEDINWLITDYTITVNCNGKTHMLPRSDSYADRLIEVLRSKNYSELPNLLSAAERIHKFSNGIFEVKDGQIYIEGTLAPQVLGTKIKYFADAGLPYEPLVLFAKNLQRNPSERAVTELFQFLEKNNHPITDNGKFIAYKKVREDFKDVHSGTFDNSVGKIIEMARGNVNDDPNQTCSYGLHVANFSYARDFYAGGHMLEVEVDPADVVAIPIDYYQAKMRVCKYKVLSVVSKELSVPIRYTNVLSDDGEDSLEDDSDEESDREDSIQDDNDSDSDEEKDCEDCDGSGCEWCQLNWCDNHESSDCDCPF